MCGRFTHRLTYRQIVDLYQITEQDVGSRQPDLDLKPRNNVAPTPVERLWLARGRDDALRLNSDLSERRDR